MVVRTRLGAILTTIAIAGCWSVSSNPIEVRLSDIDGRPFDFWKQVESAITVVVFTRTDCPIANRFAPEINRLFHKFNSRGVSISLVYIEPQLSIDQVRSHLQAYGLQCQALQDPGHTLVAWTGAKTTPEAAVFTKDRKMVYRGRINDLYVELGQARATATSHDLEEAIEAATAGRPVPTPRTQAVGCLIADLKK